MALTLIQSKQLLFKKPATLRALLFYYVLTSHSSRASCTLACVSRLNNNCSPILNVLRSFAAITGISAPPVRKQVFTISLVTREATIKPLT